MIIRNCRFCGDELNHTFIDLGLSPLSNQFITPEKASQMNRFYPLHAFVCETCFLVQLEEFETPSDIFTEYAYFSSFSESWLEHARKYTDKILHEYNINSNCFVAEIACNDGYLLQYFKEKEIPVLGIEPAQNVAMEAMKKGIPVISEFFGRKLALDLVAQGKKANLLIANNVLAHVPDLNDFVSGLSILLDQNGVLTMEFPHLYRLMEENQFDTIYHEHFSYFSFYTVRKVLEKHGLLVFDVEELETHGGSLRIYVKHSQDQSKLIAPSVFLLDTKEEEAGMSLLNTYTSFTKRVEEVKRSILQFLINQKALGKSIVGYGAPAKGNTLLNYCGVRKDFIDYVVDKNPYKQGQLLPGTLIPIHNPDEIKKTKPDFVVIMPWNLKDEIIDQMSYIRSWGGQFVVWVPQVEVL